MIDVCFSFKAKRIAGEEEKELTLAAVPTAERNE